ncbi:MAG TPA: hypothetical protein VJC20_00195 [Candidatus Paceibacterota bacterium]
MTRTSYNQSSGFIALTAVIVMMIVVSLFSVSANRSALGELINTAGTRASQTSFYRGDACAEEALLRLRGDASYAGETLTFPEGSCEITIIPNGSLRTITVSAAYREAYRNIQAEAVVGAHNIVLQSWKEIF